MINDGRLKLGSFIVAGAGFLDSLYLSWTKLAHTEVYCAGSSNCQTVNSSPYAEIAGVPIAILGIGAYLSLLVLLALERHGGFWRANSPLIFFGISLAGVLYSIYLTYIELFVLRAICPYCLVSAIALVVLLILAIFRLSRDQAELTPIGNGGD